MKRPIIDGETGIPNGIQARHSGDFLNLRRSYIFLTNLEQIYGSTMTAEQVCEICGIKRDTLRHWNSQRRISYIKLGHRTVMYSTADISALLIERYRPAIGDNRSQPNIKPERGKGEIKTKSNGKYRHQTASRMLQNAKRDLGL